MIFLHGGNDHPDLRAETFGRFVQAATVKGSCRLALIVAEMSEAQARASYADYRQLFTAVPCEVIPVFVSAERPLTRANLEDITPTGVFVCGGITPLYHQALCLNRDWLEYLQVAKILYCGTSAGAAIAARQAILGGWQAARGGQTRSILFEGASEGLDRLAVQPGLGLVSFAIDVHASQMGTLTRLIHAVELGLVTDGWGIDENTMLQVDGEQISVYGRGHAYRVWRGADHAVQIEIKTAA